MTTQAKTLVNTGQTHQTERSGQLVKEGVPLKEINKKLDDAYNMARTNVLRKTKSPLLKNLLSEWWRLTEDWASDRQDLPDRQAGQAESRQEGTAREEEAGKAKTEA
jgi:hypothetical protein